MGQNIGSDKRHSRDMVEWDQPTLPMALVDVEPSGHIQLEGNTDDDWKGWDRVVRMLDRILGRR